MTILEALSLTLNTHQSIAREIIWEEDEKCWYSGSVQTCRALSTLHNVWNIKTSSHFTSPQPHIRSSSHRPAVHICLIWTLVWINWGINAIMDLILLKIVSTKSFLLISLLSSIKVNVCLKCKIFSPKNVMFMSHFVSNFRMTFL